MLVTGLCFVAVTALVKLLEGRVPAPQAAFLRYALGLVFLIPMLRPMWAARLVLTRGDLGWFALRGAVHTLGVMLWFYSMSRITLAEVTAMNYLTPVYVTVGAALILGERLAFRRLAAVGMALVGAIIILRPGFQTLDPGHIAMLFTAVLLGGSYLLAKHLSGKASAAVIVGMLSIVVTIGLVPFAIAVWVPPSLGDLALLFGVAIFATAGHYTMTLAFAAAPVAVTQPVTFLQLVWAVLLGWIVFEEAIDGWVVLGGCVILAAVSYITWREAVLKRRALAAAVTPVHVATKV